MIYRLENHNNTNLCEMRYIGAHIKKETSVLKTLQNIKKSSGNALQIFVSNPRSCQCANKEKYITEANEIKQYCKNNDMKIIIHAPYTINVAKEPKDGKRILELSDCYWINLLINNLEVSDIINAIGVVFHVGKYTSGTKESGTTFMYNALKHIISIMKTKNIKSKLIIETPAGAGTELLTSNSEFIEFYHRFTEDERQYLKICLDTAHVWSAGEDINKYYAMIDNLKDIVVIHYNNSKKDKGSHVDVHETILDGKIDISSMSKFLKNVKYDPVIILEKPSENLSMEIEWVQNQKR